METTAVLKNKQCNGRLKGVRERNFMTWMKTYRTVVLINLLLIFAQFGFAGQMLAGSSAAIRFHGFTGVLLVLIALIQAAVSIVLKAKGIGPSWLVGANVGVIVAVAIEAVCGHFHYLALHVPLALGIFAGVMRQLFWAVRETRTASELPIRTGAAANS
jgi:hypothetical protein